MTTPPTPEDVRHAPMKLLIRIECQPEVAQALVQAWLEDHETTITTAISPERGAPTVDHSVRLTYVKEQ